MKKMNCIVACFLVIAAVLLGCNSEKQISLQASPVESREEAVSGNAVKITPQTDIYPPQLHSDEYLNPVPLGPVINTAGAEDSPFITPDGNTLYFWFTPDAKVPPQKQLLDGVTGIYVSHKDGDQWTMPERISLIAPPELALDGCEFVQGDSMWFCSARKGNFRGVDMYTAQYLNGKWQNWQNAGKKLNQEYKVGELHVSSGGNEIYFHSDRPGGKGGLDLWMTSKVNNDWQNPVNLAVVNTPDNEGWPYLSQDGQELWFLRFYKGSPAIFRAKKVSGDWMSPELIISQFAGEPSLDNKGNIYFVHHYYKDSKMIEADIYVARHK